jgi:hypothetical protein
MPWISYPRLAKYAHTSEPMRPDEPVTRHFRIYTRTAEKTCGVGVVKSVILAALSGSA